LLRSSKITGRIPYRSDRRAQGFTIIEVMIVLAIAALILLIVLLAVPALQRNSRNTAIKNDASAVIAGVSEFKSNNNGKLPSRSGGSQYDNKGTITLDNTGASPVNVKVQGSDKVRLRSSTSIYSTSPKPGWLWIEFKTKCTTHAVSGHTITSEASSASTTVIYAVETANDYAARCVDG
jgi:prepilin-type N-terminal cleavage/methylation domain-containing protein